MMPLRLGRMAPPDNEVTRARRRVAPATAVSLLVHVVIGVVLWNVLLTPVALERLFRFARSPQPPEESLRFVTVAPTTQPATLPDSGRRTRAATDRRPSAPPLVAPREVPSAIPAPAPATPSAAPPATSVGPLAGGAGPSKGVQPTYVDPRVWVVDPSLIYAPKTSEERLDSAVVATLKRHLDSLAATTHEPNKFERGDWTVEKNGRKYGIDQNYIRLGKFSIPTALLALLPFNRQANPTEVDRASSMAAMRADIVYHAQAAMNEEEFRQAVRAIRDRKERERKTLAQRLPGRKGDPQSTVSPGDRPPE